MCTLAFALVAGSPPSGAVALVLAPVCCLAAGVVVARAGGAVLTASERVTRRGPLLIRVAVVSLARSPSAPALAMAFITVSTGLGSCARLSGDP